MVSLTIIRSHKRRASLQLRAIDNQNIELRIPQKVSLDVIVDTILRHQKFIERALRSARPQLPGKVSIGETIFIFGEKYAIEFQPRIQDPLLLETPTQKSIIIPSKQESITRKEFYKKIKSILLSYISDQTKKDAILMGNLEYKGIRIKLVRSLWGSCSSKGNLSFNVKLLHYPEAVIRYVVVHELAHLIERNHSQAFWDIVEKFDRNYKEHRKILKSHQFG